MPRRWKNAWPKPPIFELVRKCGGIEPDEMWRVFNMGIGMTMVVAPTNADAILERLHKSGVPSWVIGRVEPGKRVVRFA